MELRSIENKQDYIIALARFESLFLAEDVTKESDEANILALAIEGYEKLHYAIEMPAPIDA